MSNDSPRSPAIVNLYEQYLVDQDSARMIRRASLSYTVSTLERLAEWGNRLTRRAAVLAIGLLGDYTSNPVLGRALNDDDRGVRSLAETGIRNLWCRLGGEANRHCIKNLHRLNGSKQYEECIIKATDLIHEHPWIAEAWNQRAIAHFHRGQYEESLRDCHQTLEINPYHFAAATGMGKCYVQQKNQTAALESFRRALRLNPGLDDVRAYVIHLQRAL